MSVSINESNSLNRQTQGTTYADLHHSIENTANTAKPFNIIGIVRQANVSLIVVVVGYCIFYGLV